MSGFMSGLALKSPIARLFNNTGAAGPRRLLMIGGVAVVAIGGVAFVTLRNGQNGHTPTIAKAPHVDPLPGGPHSTPAYSELALQSDQEKARRAEAAGQSFTATMPGSETAVPIPKPQPEAPPITPPAPRPAPREAQPPLAPVRAAPVEAPPRATPVAAQQRPDDGQTKAYQAAISSLFAGWGSKPQLTEVILKPEDTAHGAGGAGDPDRGERGGSAPQSASGDAPIPNARRLGGRAAGQVLMPAGRSVYGRTILASSSDQGGPVVVEAQSGPIIGYRMTGTFERKDDRLVVHLDTITLQDGTQEKIDALVIAPDSMETSVASSVDQHYLSRYLLPVAAAFVSGLGQAIGQSNSTVVASPLGGATAFQKLNLDQELGVAAGAAANQFGQAVQANAPHGPTVKLDANVNVGVLFLAPLTIGGER